MSEHAETIVACIAERVPNYGGDLDLPFEAIGLDSFAMLALRADVERAFGSIISDHAWSAVATPRDLLALAVPRNTGQAPWPARAPRRSYTIGMPQMSNSGLSEFWLFKETGDLHWQIIADGLGTPSAGICSAEGERLYATFTRVHLRADRPLREFRESEPIEIAAKPSRYGGGLFFSDIAVRLRDERAAGIALMSTFSKRGVATGNDSLIKGQPVIPDHCPIPNLPGLPPFGVKYQDRRAYGAPRQPAIFECRYDVVPFHDINGVGLLYFAAYPLISDICAMRYAGRGFADLSTMDRDVCYFANCNVDDTILYRLHATEETEETIYLTSSLSRASDGALMALITTRKAKP
jgi:probable biosynthetic protein (TIGR04098 family)